MPPVPATPNLGGVSTRMLIILALVCGLAVLVAFAGQPAQIVCARHGVRRRVLGDGTASVVSAPWRRRTSTS